MTTGPIKGEQMAPLIAPGRRAVAAAQEQLLAEATVDIRPRRIRLARGLTLQALEVGEGDPLVLLHGSATSAVQMIPLLEHLAGRRLVVVDRPGYGLSDPVDYAASDYRRTAVDVVTALLDALELDRADLLGNSTGSVWSLWTALDLPQRVRRLVLVGATPLLEGTVAPLAFRLMTTPLLGRLLLRVMPSPSPASVKQMMTAIGEGDTITRYPHQIDAFVAAASDAVAGKAMRDELGALIRGVLGFRPRRRFQGDDLRRVVHPTLLVWGDHDPVGDVAAARRAASLLPDARLEILPTGHAPWLGQPERTAQVIKRFLDGEADIR